MLRIMFFSVNALVLNVFLLTVPIKAQPDTLWTRTFGGSEEERSYSVQQTTDGGFILTGMTDSFGAGNYDLWLIRTNSSGDILWTKTYGGSDWEWGNSVQQTPEGNFIVGGYTFSLGAGNGDGWLLKVDSTGNIIWSQTYGGSEKDEINYVRQTSDGGFIMAGTTESFGAGGGDFWLIRTDTSGDTLWTKAFGRDNYELGKCVQQTADGGFIVAGYTISFGAGLWDVWLIKTDSSGNALWSRTYGGPSSDKAYSIDLTDDGGFILVGSTSSYGAGSRDVWLVKIDAAGNILWSKTHGGEEDDVGFSVQQTHDRGFIIAGRTTSFSRGLNDVWVVKTDSIGEALWANTFGGGAHDGGYSVYQNFDKGFIVTGGTNSYGAGNGDIWLIRIARGVKGDLSGNWIVDVMDIIRAIDITLYRGEPPTEHELWAADINEDDEINIFDILLIIKKALGRAY